MSGIPVELPDAKAAVLEHLRQNALVTSICPASQIKGTMPSPSKTSNGYYLTAIKIPGGSADRDRPRSSIVIEIRCYGPNAAQAMQLSRAVQMALIPYDRRSYGFTQKGCRVYDVVQRVGHAEFFEPGYDGDGAWAMCRQVIEVFYWEYTAD